MKFKNLPKAMRIQALKVDRAKKVAYYFGLKGKTFADFAKATNVGSDPILGGRNGIYAEIILAWMCGKFHTVDPDFTIEFSCELDHTHKADFVVVRYNGEDYDRQKVQVKYDTDRLCFLPKDVILCRLGPDPKAFDKHLPAMTGIEAFKHFLISTELYIEEEITRDEYLNSKEFIDKFNTAWKML